MTSRQYDSDGQVWDVYVGAQTAAEFVALCGDQDIEEAVREYVDANCDPQDDASNIAAILCRYIDAQTA